MKRARNHARSPVRSVSLIGWATIVAFVVACVGYQLGAITRSSTLVILAAALVSYASIVAVLGRVH